MHSRTGLDTDLAARHRVFVAGTVAVRKCLKQNILRRIFIYTEPNENFKIVLALPTRLICI